MYGTATAPLYDLTQYQGKLPIAFVAGTTDELGNPTDVQWLYEQLGSENVVFYESYPLGHLSFFLGSDVSWFTEDVMPLIDQYSTNAFTQ